MKRKILGVVVSIALAGLGTFLVLAYVNDADERAAEGQERVDVLVVSDPVTAGEPAQSLVSKVEPLSVPVNAQATGAVASLDQLEGRVAAVDLLPGEQVLEARFVTEESLAEDLGVEIPDDLLQLTVSLAPDRAVGGRLVAGDTVAVVSSFDPFEIGAIEPGEIDLFFGSAPEPGDDGEDDRDLKTPNSTHIILHKVLVTAVQIERLPAQLDREDAAEAGVELAPTGNLLITLALKAPDVEKVVFTAEHGSLWLAHEPEAASEAGTQIQTRGTIYR